MRQAKRAFSLIEIVGCMLIIGILTVAGIVAISSQIKASRRSAAQTDLKAFETALTSALIEKPMLAKIPTKYNSADVLSGIATALEQEMRVDFSHSGTELDMSGGTGTMTKFLEAESDTASATKVLATFRSDPWKNRYKIWVNCKNLQATGDNLAHSTSHDSELRVFIISNGPNGTTGLTPNLIDKEDDIILMVEIVNGEVRAGYYGIDNISDTQKIVWASSDAANPTVYDDSVLEYDMSYAYLPLLQ